MSRAKGKRGELDVVHRFHAAGFTDVRRNGDAGQIDGDLAGAPDYTEVRFRETLNIPAWIRECEEECPPGKDWALAFRRTREPWCVALTLDHYLDLLRRAHG